MQTYHQNSLNYVAAFGSAMPTRSWTDESRGYRYGFNGKESDKESGLQDYGFRIYNQSLGRFLSVDPISADYPWYTPYQFAGNTVIAAADLDGLEPDLKTSMLPKTSYFKRSRLDNGNIRSGMTNTQKVGELKKRIANNDGFYIAFDKSTGKTIIQKVETVIKKVDADGLKIEYENRLTTYYLDENGNIETDKTTSTSQDMSIQVNSTTTDNGKTIESIGVHKEEGKKENLFLGSNKFDDASGFVSVFGDFVKHNNNLIRSEKMTPEQTKQARQLGAITGFVTRGLKLPGVSGGLVNLMVSNYNSGYVTAKITPEELSKYIDWLKTRVESSEQKVADSD